MRIKNLIFFLVLYIFSNGYSQVCRSGIDFFNAGEYTAAADTFQAFADEHVNVRGYHNYWAGEALYNAGLSSTNTHAAADFFTRAGQLLTGALIENDIRNNQLLRDKIQLKRTWCAFRLFCLANDVHEKEHQLEQIIESESLLRENMDREVLTQYHLLIGSAYYVQADLLVQAGLQSQYERNIYAIAITKSRDHFSACKTLCEPALRPYADLALASIMQLQALVTQSVMHITDQAAGDSADTEKWNMPVIKSPPIVSEYVHVFDAFTLFYNAYYNHYKAEDDTFIDAFNDKLGSSVFENIAYFPGEIDFLHGLYSNMAQIDYFFKNHHVEIDGSKLLESTLPEAPFWQGMDLLCCRDENNYRNYTAESSRLFTSFLDDKTIHWNFSRFAYLRSIAQLLLLENRFEACRTASDFRNFIGELNKFTEFTDLFPRAEADSLQFFHIASKKLFLRKFARMLADPSAGSIFDVVGNNREEALQYAILIIPYAVTASNGADTKDYLNVIDRLLQIAGVDSDLTPAVQFYKRIFNYVSGLIEDNEIRQRNYFLEAAKPEPVNDDSYRLESLYIQGVCYYEAAVRSIDAGDKGTYYRKAEQRFLDIVGREDGGLSLRALYYLSEVYKELGGLDTIEETDKTVYRQYSKWGYVKIDQYLAKISVAPFPFLNKIKNDVETEITLLANVRSQQPAQVPSVEDLVYPDNFVLEPLVNKFVSLQSFSNTYVSSKKFYQKRINLFLLYGYRPKAIFPSKNVTSAPGSADHYYTRLNNGLQESLSNIDLEFNVKVNLPAGAGPRTFVAFNHKKILPDEGGIYRAGAANLSDNIHVFIQNEDCFVYQHTFRLGPPGNNNITVSLLKKFTVLGDEVKVNDFPADKKYFREERLDRNFIMNNNGYYHLVDDRMESLEITSDYLKNDSFRDFCYFNSENQFYSVSDNIGDGVILYNANGKKLDKLELPLLSPGEQLVSPEGITVSSDGTLYVVDYQKNQVLKWNPYSGEPVTFLGITDSKDNSDGIKMVSFTKPKRIAVVDNIHMSADNSYTQSIMFVTDDEGIKCFDDNGYYLDTLTSKNIINAKNITAISAEYHDSIIDVFYVDKITHAIYRQTLAAE